MERHDLTIADIEAHIGGGKKRGRKPDVHIATKAAGAVKTKSVASAKGKLPPKYRDPKTGATWSSHARPPQWIAGAKDRTKFLIDGSSAAVNVGAANKSKAAAKAAGKTAAKGKLPPKYRNPKTGETWSGHARPPAWIKDVKDRTKFLIAGAGEGSAEPKAAAAQKAPARNAAAKKVADKKATAKKGVAKKVTAKKGATTAKKAPAKKAAVRKPAVKKAVAKKGAMAAKKVPAKKAALNTASAVSAPPVTTERTPMYLAQPDAHGRPTFASRVRSSPADKRALALPVPPSALFRVI
jgi:DNA-binding protein H-NS